MANAMNIMSLFNKECSFRKVEKYAIIGVLLKTL